MSEEFDFGSLGKDWWTESGASIGCDIRQIKFACHKHMGCSNTEAARQSGYSPGNEQGMRAEGYRVSRSNKVMALLQLAHAETGTGPDGVVDVGEAKRILSSLARGSDPAVRIRAIEQLQRMEDAAKASAVEEGPGDPIKTCSELNDALIAAFMLAHHNITKAPDWLKEKLPAAALAATRVRSLNTTWSRAFVDEIAGKFGIKLDDVSQHQAGNGHVHAA